MTRDIDQLSKVAEKFDKSGYFASSEVVDNLIKRISNKLSSNEYRAVTKKIRNAVKDVAGSVKSKDDMIEQLLRIASQFDLEGNFEEADRLTATAKALLEKKKK